MGIAKTLMAFIVSASRVLANKVILKELIGAAARLRCLWAGQSSFYGQGPEPQPLSTAAMAACLDSKLKSAEWEGICPWKAVVCINRLISCWELEMPKAMCEAPAGNVALVAAVQALAVWRISSPPRGTSGDGENWRGALYTPMTGAGGPHMDAILRQPLGRLQ